MKATGALKHEHEAIRLMLQIMEAACVKIETEKKVHVADVDEMIDFLKVFADQCHHGKKKTSYSLVWKRLVYRGKAVQLASCLRSMSKAENISPTWAEL